MVIKQITNNKRVTINQSIKKANNTFITNNNTYYKQSENTIQYKIQYIS